jgi:hypothetical protein
MQTTTYSSSAAVVPGTGGNAALLEMNSAVTDLTSALTGLDDIRPFLQDLRHRVEQFELTQDISVEHLFTPGFMQECSAFDSLDHMVTAAAVAVGDSIDELDTNEQWKQFVVDRTRFESWDDMRDEAVRGWIADELGLTHSDRGTRQLDRMPQEGPSSALECCPL